MSTLSYSKNTSPTFNSHQYVKQFGTSSFDDARAISTDNSGNVYVTGTTAGSLSDHNNLGSNDAYIAKYDANGNQIWLEQFGTIYQEFVSGISSDSNNNIYVTGTTYTISLGNNNLGNHDHYITKYDANGNQIWFQLFGTASDDFGFGGISTDSSNNVYVAGTTLGSVTSNSNFGYYDVYIAKYDANGNQIWLQQFGSSNSEGASAISSDLNGNVYITGHTFGDLSGNGNFGASDTYIAKYDTSGNQIWLRQFGTSFEESGYGITTDSNGNAYVAGMTSGSLPGNINLGYQDAYIAKYDSSGNQLWVKQFGTSNTDEAFGITNDSSGNIYLTGYTSVTLLGNINLGSNDAFIAKYDANGNQLWVKQFGSSSADYAKGISIDNSGNVYVSGYTDGSLPGNTNLGSQDAFIVGFDSNGNLLDPSVISFGSATYSVNENGTPVTAITINRTGNLTSAVTVTLTPSNGTASAPADYNNTPIVINFAANESSKVITIPIINDTLAEWDETINLTLSNPTNGASLGSQTTATLTIIDNDPKYVKQFGTYTYDTAEGISTGSSGNVYVTGSTWGSLPGNPSLTSLEAFVARYDASGSQVWIKQFGSSSHDYALGISTDSNSNVYVTGHTSGASLPGNINFGESDAFVVKYDINGSQIWAKQFGTSSQDYAYGISTDNSNNIYVTGRTEGSLPGYSNFGSSDAFVTKYDVSGNQLWIRQFGTSRLDWASGISTDNSGNVYIAGRTEASLPGNTNFGYTDAFISKYDTNGNQLWVKQFGSSFYERANAISTDNSGNVYVSGVTNGSLQGNTNFGSDDAFIAKYDANGNQLWVKQFGSSMADQAYAITTDNSGNVYVTGNTASSLPGYSNLGNYDIFVIKYAINGDQLWVQQFGSSLYDQANGISTDINGNVYVTGNTEGSLPGNTNFGTQDAFIVGFDSNGNLLDPRITGDDEDNYLLGNSGNDTIQGLGGNDTLDGGIGADSLLGGDGNDTYFIDNVGDIVSETNAVLATGGTDTVNSSITYSLTANVENLTLTGIGNINGTGNTLNNKIIANAGKNILTGGAGNDTLNGSAGNDTLNGDAGNDSLIGGLGVDSMIGGDGSDIYSVDNVGDVVVETNAVASTGGTDTVNSTVTYTLSANVEKLTLTGTANINGTGNALANTITGNTAANILTGGDGNDTLLGGTGNDTLVGGNGADSLTGGTGLDVFRFNSTLERIDRITDFAVVDDTIQVSASGFGGGLVANAAITTSQFVLGAAATTTANRFGYNSSTGSLWFDADGSGATAAVQFATLNTGLALTNADIFVV